MMSFFKRKYNKKYKAASWVEESFSFETIYGKQVATAQSDEFVGKSVQNQNIIILFIFFACIFLLLWSRFIYIQIIEGTQYRQVAENNRERTLSIPSERGIIYDRNKIPLTQNVPNFSLAISPQDLPSNEIALQKIGQRLSQLSGTPENEILELLKDVRSNRSKYRSFVIKENLDYESALLFQIEASDLPGVHIERGSKRLYYQTFVDGMPVLNFPSSTVTSTSSSTSTVHIPRSLSHIIGYLGKVNTEELAAFEKQDYLLSDTIGKNGLEKTYEENLRGKYGIRSIEVDTSGRQQIVLGEEAPTPGTHLVLSIDITIQQKLEEILQKYMDQFQKKRASAVAMDPNSGEILAMVSLPAFDNNDFSGGIKSDVYRSYIEDPNLPLFNRAISGNYPSGSTIKPAIAAAALQEGTITPDTTVLSNGGIHIGQWFFPDWKAGGHGVTDVKKSLAQSVNTFYYAIGGGFGNIQGLGVDKIVSYLKLFGISEPLGIDIPSERSGFLPSKEWKEKTKNEKWYIGDTYNLSIGQGDLLVTPLQIAEITASVANKGILYKPHVGLKLLNPITKEETNIENKVIRKDFIRKENFMTVGFGMRDCVISGSCRRLASLPINVAGKTGTAQWNTGKDNHAWFTSYAPFEKPEIVLTVLIEEGEEGSRTAVPVGYDFYKWWAEYKNK